MNLPHFLVIAVDTHPPFSKTNKKTKKRGKFLSPASNQRIHNLQQDFSSPILRSKDDFSCRKYKTEFFFKEIYNIKYFF